MNNEKPITWPTIQQQIDYWNQQDEELSRAEAAREWLDEFRPWQEMLDQMEERLQDDGRSDGYGESYAERNL